MNSLLKLLSEAEEQLREAESKLKAIAAEKFDEGLVGRLEKVEQTRKDVTSALIRERSRILGLFVQLLWMTGEKKAFRVTFTWKVPEPDIVDIMSPTSIRVRFSDQEPISASVFCERSQYDFPHLFDTMLVEITSQLRRSEDLRNEMLKFPKLRAEIAELGRQLT